MASQPKGGLLDFLAQSKGVPLNPLLAGWMSCVLLLGCTGTDKGTDKRTVEPEPEVADVSARSCEVLLEHSPAVQALAVEVAGEFTGWEPLLCAKPNCLTAD